VLLTLAFAAAAFVVPRAGRAQEGEQPLASWIGKLPPAPPMYNESWKGCGEITMLFVPIGGGTWETTYSPESGTAADENPDGNYQAVMHVGLRAAGYGVLRHGFQLGGFAAADLGRMRYSIDLGGEPASDDRPVALDSSLGFAFKWGTVAQRKVFFGIGLDLGLAVHHADVTNGDVRTQFGIAGSPRLLFEFPLGDKDHCAINFALGFAASIVNGRALDSTDRISTRWLRLEPVAQLGVAFGG
jgi:hypothetical protein